jgi:hypothetical protein
MPLNLFSRAGAASGKTAKPRAKRPVRTSREIEAMRDGLAGFSADFAAGISTGLSTLAGFEPALRLIDHIDAALAPHDTIVAMAAAQRFQ